MPPLVMGPGYPTSSPCGHGTWILFLPPSSPWHLDTLLPAFWIWDMDYSPPQHGACIPYSPTPPAINIWWSSLETCSLEDLPPRTEWHLVAATKTRTVGKRVVHILLECCLVTARKRSLGQGNIFAPVCHSVHGGGSASVHAGITPREQTPPEQCMLGDTANKRALRILLECILVLLQGSHFFVLTKFHISMIFPGFFSKFPGIFSLFLKYDIQVVWNINMQTYWVSFEQKIKSFPLYSKLVNLPFYFSNLVNFILFQGSQGWIFSSHQVFPGFMSFFHDIY